MCNNYNMVITIIVYILHYTTCINNTVEPLLMDTLYKGHNRKDFHIKDRFKWGTWQYIFSLQREDNLFIKDKMSGPIQGVLYIV